jgi:L-alanine-DL-glutamate epimerase-like enolase superfamily enzyme
MTDPYKIDAVQGQPAPYPMARAFTSARRSSQVADNVLVTARLRNGTTGYGEASPAAYVTRETPTSVLFAVAGAAAEVENQDVRLYRRWSESLRSALPEAPAARSAIEMALLDALSRCMGVSLWQWLGGAVPEVRTDLSIPLCAAEQAGESARTAAEAGYRSLKIKVGGPDLQADVERVLAVSHAAPGCSLRLDANQGFSATTALQFTRRLLAKQVRVELLEQPVARDDLEALAAVTRRSPVPVIADESVISPADALRVAAMEAAHGVNIKLAKSGVAGALEIVAIARAAGLRLMLGCMLESLLGLGAAVHLACGVGAFDYLDLDAHVLLGLKARGEPFAQVGDLLSPAAVRAGIGWDPDTT